MEHGQLDEIHHNNPNHHSHHSHSHSHSYSHTTTTTTVTEKVALDPKQAYKLEKQAFVSDLNGASVWKINAVSLTAITTYALWATIRSRNLRFVPPSARVHSILSHPSISFLDDVQLEFIILILPMLLANTLFAHHVLIFNLVIVSLILFINWKWPSPSKNQRSRSGEGKTQDSSNSNPSNSKPDSLGIKTKHQRHWSKKFISDDEDEMESFNLLDQDEELNENMYSQRKISFEDEKVARHSRGESLSTTRSQTHSRIPSLISEENAANYPFRVSVDSVASLARFNANPPTTYLPPGVNEDRDPASLSYHQEESAYTPFTSSNSRQATKDHHSSRNSISSNTSHQGENFNDILRSTLPPLKISNEETLNERRQSTRSTTSSHSSYGSPIEPSTSARPMGSSGRSNFSPAAQSQDRIGRITSPLGRMRSSNSNLTSSYHSNAEDVGDRSETLQDEELISESQSNHPQLSRHQHRSQQFSTSSTASSSFSNAFSSPSRPPSAPPASNTSPLVGYPSFSNSHQRFSDDGPNHTNSVPTSPQQQVQSLNQPQFSSFSEPLLQNRNSEDSNPISQRLQTQSTSNSNPFVAPQPFLTIYRSHMMLMTLICILAVDFKIFPREFAKCETYGTSLMDLGVGSFVFSLGLISALPILKRPRNRFKPLRKQMLESLKKSAPILVIGGIRVLLVKGVDYHEHISEYGLHWNFFITLGLLPLIMVSISKVFGKFFRYNSIGFTIGFGYQLLLSFTSLEDFVISNDHSLRTNLISQNKEGIFSLSGYLSIFLIGLDLGFYVLPLDPYFAYRRLSKTRRKPKTEKLIMILASFSIIWWAFYGALSLFGLQVSRRLANLSYVIWVVAFNTSFICAYTCVYWFWLKELDSERNREALTERKKSKDSENEKSKIDETKVTPVILDALNSHSFVIFLAANLLTGVINLSIKTIHTNSSLSFLILSFYLALCMGLAVVMQRKGWKIRL